MGHSLKISFLALAACVAVFFQEANAVSRDWFQLSVHSESTCDAASIMFGGFQRTGFVNTEGTNVISPHACQSFDGPSGSFYFFVDCSSWADGAGFFTVNTGCDESCTTCLLKLPVPPGSCSDFGLLDYFLTGQCINGYEGTTAPPVPASLASEGVYLIDRVGSASCAVSDGDTLFRSWFSSSWCEDVRGGKIGYLRDCRSGELREYVCDFVDSLTCENCVAASSPLVSPCEELKDGQQERFVGCTNTSIPRFSANVTVGSRSESFPALTCHPSVLGLGLTFVDCLQQVLYTNCASQSCDLATCTVSTSIAFSCSPRDVDSTTVIEATYHAEPCPILDVGSLLDYPLLFLKRSACKRPTFSCGYRAPFVQIFTWTAPSDGDFVFQFETGRDDFVVGELRDAQSLEILVCNSSGILIASLAQGQKVEFSVGGDAANFFRPTLLITKYPCCCLVGSNTQCLSVDTKLECSLQGGACAAVTQTTPLLIQSAASSQWTAPRTSLYRFSINSTGLFQVSPFLVEGSRDTSLMFNVTEHQQLTFHRTGDFPVFVEEVPFTCPKEALKMGANNFQNSAGPSAYVSSCAQTKGPEQLFSFVAPSNGTYWFTVSGSFAFAFEIRHDCDMDDVSSVLRCKVDDIGVVLSLQDSIYLDSGQNVVILVDGLLEDDFGDLSITVALQQPQEPQHPPIDQMLQESLDMNGAMTHEFLPLQNLYISEPLGIDVDEKFNMYVFMRENIVKLDPAGDLLFTRNYPNTDFTGMCVDSTSIYIANATLDSASPLFLVLELDRDTGAPINEFVLNDPRLDIDVLLLPRALGCTSAFEFLVATETSGPFHEGGVQLVMKNGSHVRSFRDGFPSGPQLNGIAISNHYIFVTDRDTVFKFDHDLTLLSQISVAGEIRGIGVDVNSLLVRLEREIRIHSLMSGALITTHPVGLDACEGWRSLSIDSVSRIYSVCQNFSRVSVGMRSNLHVRSYGSSSPVLGSIFAQRNSGIVVDSSSRIYVSNVAQKSITIFDDVGQPLDVKSQVVPTKLDITGDGHLAILDLNQIIHFRGRQYETVQIFTSDFALTPSGDSIFVVGNDDLDRPYLFKYSTGDGPLANSTRISALKPSPPSIACSDKELYVAIGSDIVIYSHDLKLTRRLLEISPKLLNRITFAADFLFVSVEAEVFQLSVNSSDIIRTWGDPKDTNFIYDLSVDIAASKLYLFCSNSTIRVITNGLVERPALVDLTIPSLSTDDLVVDREVAAAGFAFQDVDENIIVLGFSGRDVELWRLNVTMPIEWQWFASNQLGFFGSFVPELRSSFNTFTLGGEGFMFGGIQNGQVLNDLWRLSLDTFLWTQMSPNTMEINLCEVPPCTTGIPSPRHSATFWEYGGEAFIFGGVSGSGDHLDDLWAYSPISNNWRWVTRGASNSTSSSPCSTCNSSCELRFLDCPEEPKCIITTPGPLIDPIVWQVGSETYVSGGRRSNGQSTSDTFKFSHLDEQWSIEVGHYEGSRTLKNHPGAHFGSLGLPSKRNNANTFVHIGITEDCDNATIPNSLWSYNSNNRSFSLVGARTSFGLPCAVPPCPGTVVPSLFYSKLAFSANVADETWLLNPFVVRWDESAKGFEWLKGTIADHFAGAIRNVELCSAGQGCSHPTFRCNVTLGACECSQQECRTHFNGTGLCVDRYHCVDLVDGGGAECIDSSWCGGNACEPSDDVSPGFVGRCKCFVWFRGPYCTASYFDIFPFSGFSISWLITVVGFSLSLLLSTVLILVYYCYMVKYDATQPMIWCIWLLAVGALVRLIYGAYALALGDQQFIAVTFAGGADWRSGLLHFFSYIFLSFVVLAFLRMALLWIQVVLGSHKNRRDTTKDTACTFFLIQLFIWMGLFALCVAFSVLSSTSPEPQIRVSYRISFLWITVGAYALLGLFLVISGIGLIVVVTKIRAAAPTKNRQRSHRTQRIIGILLALAVVFFAASAVVAVDLQNISLGRATQSLVVQPIFEVLGIAILQFAFIFLQADKLKRSGASHDGSGTSSTPSSKSTALSASDL